MNNVSDLVYQFFTGCWCSRFAILCRALIRVVSGFTALITISGTGAVRRTPTLSSAPVPIGHPFSALDGFSPPAVVVAKTLVWLGGVAAADFFGVTLAISRYALSGQSLSLCS